MSTQKESPVVLSKQALQRMPFYLQYLKKLSCEGQCIIAAPAVAEALSLNEVQVRKDFAAVSSTRGKPKTGFVVPDLIADMETFLGYRNVNEAVLVGAGSLGKALLSYKGFDDYGIKIAMAFDANEQVIGGEIFGKRIFSVTQLSDLCRRMRINIGIITVPAPQAQSVCDSLVAGGVRAIWNFAPAHLSAPAHILIQNENMAASLALLSKHLNDQIGR